MLDAHLYFELGARSVPSDRARPLSIDEPSDLDRLRRFATVLIRHQHRRREDVSGLEIPGDPNLRFPYGGRRRVGDDSEGGQQRFEPLSRRGKIGVTGHDDLPSDQKCTRSLRIDLNIHPHLMVALVHQNAFTTRGRQPMEGRLDACDARVVSAVLGPIEFSDSAGDRLGRLSPPTLSWAPSPPGPTLYPLPQKTRCVPSVTAIPPDSETRLSLLRMPVKTFRRRPPAVLEARLLGRNGKHETRRPIYGREEKTPGPTHWPTPRP